MRLNPLHLHRNHIPIHTRHLVVEHHRIHRVRPEQLQALVSASRLQNFIAILFEQHPADDESMTIVVNTKDCYFQHTHCDSQSHSDRTVASEWSSRLETTSLITEVAGK